MASSIISVIKTVCCQNCKQTLDSAMLQNALSTFFGELQLGWFREVALFKLAYNFNMVYLLNKVIMSFSGKAITIYEKEIQ